MHMSFPAPRDYLDSLSRFPLYLSQAWRNIDDGHGFFGDPSHLESGIRTNGNVVFCAALLASDPSYAPLDPAFDARFLLQRARAVLRYLTQAHVTGEGRCGDGHAWGGVWQSAWWTTRMALGAKLMWEHLTTSERSAIERVVVHEADHLLPLIVPTGLEEDTKAEENAWDAEILATAIALFPDHAHRPLWWEKLCAYGFNVFSVASDRKSEAVIDGKPLREWVSTVNLHSDFTLENHGAYHFCYIASPLHSLAWASYALRSQDITPPAALQHHLGDVWNTAKSTFMDRRFAYVGGQDWARYTYGEYFIVPSLVWLHSVLGDPDARAIEASRFRTLAEEQGDNPDGSFFGRRFTRPHYRGQCAKYETDCYANLGLAYLWHRLLPPPAVPTTPENLTKNLSGRLVSPECGIAFARSSRLFASFSWKTLTTPYPLALFVPLGHDDLAEWAPGNLFGRIVLANEDPSAVWIRRMHETTTGFEIRGTVVYRGRKGRIVYTHDLEYQVDMETATATIASRFVARQKILVRRIEGLNLALPNDRFNNFKRSIFSEQGHQELTFDPERRPLWLRKHSLPYRVLRRLLRETLRDGPRHTVDSRWLNIDGVMGIVDIHPGESGFLIHQPAGRNLDNGSLHLDRVYCPVKGLNQNFRPEEEILSTRFILIAGDVAATRLLLEETTP